MWGKGNNLKGACELWQIKGSIHDTFASAPDLCEISSAGGFWH